MEAERKISQEEMKADLLALSILMDAENEKKGTQLFRIATDGMGAMLKVSFAFVKWMVLTAVALCLGICKLCFGFFFR